MTKIRDMPALLKRELTKEDCIKWKESKKKNPDNPKNPISNYRIAKDLPKYKEINSKCKELYGIASTDSSPKTDEQKVNTDICQKWIANKKINPDNPKNPITGYKISKTSAKYKFLDKMCEKLGVSFPKSPLQSPLQSPPKSPLQSPPKSPPKSPLQSPPKSPDIIKNKKPSPSQHLFAKEDDIYYPSLDDKYFRQKLVELEEYKLFQVPPYSTINNTKDFEDTSTRLCGDFEKTLYQYFVSHYISARTPYKSILLYHAVGVGKTCSAITLAEGFLVSHSMYNEPKIWVIMPKALKESFKEQIFSLSNYENFEFLSKQCTGDLYIKLLHLFKDKKDKQMIATKVKKLIQSRYRLFTYESFATFIETEYTQKNRIVKDKVIIVDEAHNIRSMNDEKRIYISLTNILQEGINNRLILLSATPMYNTPDDIYDLLYLFMLNDKRAALLNEYPFPPLFNNGVLNQKALVIMQTLASNYISYLKGKNPFTFALKLSPKYLNTVKFLTNEYELDSNNKPIPELYKGWLQKIEDGIVVSQLGSKQLEYIEKHSQDDNNVFNNLQPMNITYDNAVGEKGFSTFFTRTDDTNILQVRYNKKHMNALYPDAEHLGKYSGKFLNICNILKNTHGITVIYSGYIWAGIIPMAICLEHMGFQREGANNILENADIIPDAPRYDGIKYPKYCIMTSDNNDIMGTTTIDNMLKLINSPKNIDGSLVKVILITPVAGEGLSFYNVREMHLMEPWFHFNRVTQIIGRGVRNCRHQNLPLEKRNTTVFMHASIDNSANNETTDIHAFRIAAHKQIQSDIIEKVIRDNAIDCSLMKNINYFPKSLFELGKMQIQTSQNKAIQYEYGDDEEYEPKCGMKIPINKYTDDITDLRKDSYKHFIGALQLKIKKLILDKIHNGERYISLEEIVNMLKFNKQIIYTSIHESVYPNILIDGYILIPHNNGLHIISIEPEKITKLRITYETPDIQTSVRNKICSYNKLNAFAKKNLHSATIALYSYLDIPCFEELVKKFIESRELSETDEILATILYTQGALIGVREIRISTKEPNGKYIGYVNIFNEKFEGYIYTGDRYRDLTEREEAELIGVRKKVTKPTDMSRERVPWGMLIPIQDKKKSTYSNVFKLLTAGAGKSMKTGIVCTSLQKPVHDTIMQQLGVPIKNETKIDNCIYIAEELLKINRMTLYPEYKPII